MIIFSTINSNKQDLLVEKFFEQIKKGIKPEEILFLVQNARKKKNITEKIKKLSPFGNIGNLNVFSFYGLARNFIEKNWPLAQESIKFPASTVFANMCGLEVSQYIFKNSIKDVEFKGYNSKVNLLHQLLRRYSLIVQNALDENEIKKREQILKESYGQEVREALKLYKLKTLELRAFDYLRQVSIFEYLYKKIKNPYRVVIVDDADEITPAVFEYLKHIKNDTEEFIIAQDPLGSSRLGYLSAAHINFEKFLDENAKDLRQNTTRLKTAQEVFYKIKNKEPYFAKNSTVKSFIRRDEMINTTIEQIQALIKSGIKPSDIAVVTPVCDDYLRHCFKKIKQDVFFLSGSEKLNQNKTVGAVVEILKIINSPDKYISPYTLKNILLEVIKPDSDSALKITQGYIEANYEYKEPLLKYLSNLEDKKIREFLDFIEPHKEQPLSVQLYEICNKYITKTVKNQTAILKLNKLAKQISDFESVFKDNFEKIKLIEQLENTIISENPLSEDEIPQDSIIVSTAQKLIDNEICTKHLFLIDCSNSNWIKQDIGMLYNSWVFQKSWDKNTFELNDNIELTLDRTARIIYKLFLCANEKIYIYSSIYDTLGAENFGAIDRFFTLGSTTKQNPPQKIIPRDDQRAVLEYKSGKMAVSAVAGSGKTTIMLALILKLLEGEIIPELKSENIFVLTFMESAARNFRERIKQNYPDMLEMPQISTIHGLALRILKENNNYTFVNLDNDFEITDEAKRREILTKAIMESGLEYDKTELYERALSDFKNDLSSNIKKVKSPSFKRVYEIYQKEMRENNLLDYDDLLIYALKLLKENKNVLEYYQNLARVIIEDEAQDSSPVQQELIGLLGAKWGNVIRCGDVNQAITATFSNSDVKGFKKFIKENYNVEMNKSQRCGVKIIDFANNVVKNALKSAPSAFYEIKMEPVEGKNPTNPDAVELKLFENESDEKTFVANKIKEIKNKYPKKNIGVLLRSNRAIGIWADFLESCAIKTQKNIDTYNSNLAFRVTLAIFNFICDFKNKKNLQNSLKTLLEMPVYKNDYEILNFINTNDFLSSKGSKYQIWWDLKYFLLNSSATPMELVLEIGDFYFKNSLEAANIAMLYSIVDNIYKNTKNFEDTTKRMNDISQRVNKSVKFFQEEENKEDGTINIMTLHKSKGDEFDFVFIPELSSDNLGLKIDDIKLKKNTEFIQSVKSTPKTPDELKQEILEENFRLLYVGVTRAKIKLYMTCAKNFKMYNKTKEQKPCEIFEQGGINEHI